MNALSKILLTSSLTVLCGCQGNPPMPTVDYVDLSRFMGDWGSFISQFTLFASVGNQQ